MNTRELSELTLTDLWKEVKNEEAIWGDLKLEARKVLKKLLRGVLEVAMTNHLQADKHERTEKRISYRNGFYLRDLETSLGLLKDLEIPRSRDGAFRPPVFGHYKRRHHEVEDLIKDMFLAGVSTRRVGEVIQPLLGFEVSASTVSNILKSLDSEVLRFHNQALADEYIYLFLDGITLKARHALEVKKKMVLCAYGVRKDGKRKLISFRQAQSESEGAWTSFLNDLYSRGLKGKSLNLIIVDGCPGLLKALDIIYPYIPRQRCWVHKLRNVANKLPKRKQEDILKGAKVIYQAENKRAAVRCYWEWARAYRSSYPQAVECLEKDIDELLSFMDFPKKHWIKIRTTNIIERSFREVRRRTRPMSSFSNGKSVDRIIYGIICHLNTKWEKKPLKEFTQLS